MKNNCLDYWLKIRFVFKYWWYGCLPAVWSWCGGPAIWSWCWSPSGWGNWSWGCVWVYDLEKKQSTMFRIFLKYRIDNELPVCSRESIEFFVNWTNIFNSTREKKLETNLDDLMGWSWCMSISSINNLQNKL